MKNTVAKIFLFIILVCFAFSGHLINSEDETAKITMAPINEDFIKYMKDQELGIQERNFTEDGYPLGVVPSPMVLSHLISDPAIAVQAMPKKYDSLDKQSPMKNQAQCGSCWAFAITSVLECTAMRSDLFASTYPHLLESNRRQSLVDFSEQNLIDNHGFKYGPCKGGTKWMALAYYTRWDGPILESSDPYIYANSRFDSSVQLHVQNAVFVPMRSSTTDNATTKKAVMDYHGVYTQMYFADSCYNPGFTSLYNPGIEKGKHAVVIVGWDDSFSRYNFNKVPPGDGAFLVRNSWGSDWGDGGYFYVSYYDEFLGRMVAGATFPSVEPTSNYTIVYEHDPCGCTARIGYDSPKAWFANIFVAKSKCTIKAVSLYAVGTINKYKLYVHKGVSPNEPRSGTIVSKKGGKLKTPGYFTIPLKTKVVLQKGDRFSLVVQMNSKNTKNPIPIEYHFKKVTKKLKAKNGQSFISFTGKSWTDTNKWKKKTNVCLKAFGD